ncbi:MAG: hypothetical protein LC107_09975 [Chitinophagales bacterium]|nr:hypothetical protein [Chitinophagales bacterium]
MLKLDNFCKKGREESLFLNKLDDIVGGRPGATGDTDCTSPKPPDNLSDCTDGGTMYIEDSEPTSVNDDCGYM